MIQQGGTTGRFSTPAAALWTCLCLNLLNYTDRYLPFAFAERLKEEFLLNDAQVGRLGSAFLLVYSVVALPLGYLSDRVDRRKVLFGCAVLWSLATAASALSSSYAHLLFFRACVGIGEAGYAAAAPALLAERYGQEKRAQIFAWFYVAMPVGAALGYALGGVLGERVGWRSAFVLTALPGFLLAPLALRLSAGGSPSTQSAAVPRKEALARLLRNRVYWLVVAAEAAVSFSMGGVSVWFPTHLERTWQFSQAGAGLLAGALVALPSLAGSVLGGRLSSGGDSSRSLRLTLVPAAGFVAGAALGGYCFGADSRALALSAIAAAVALIFFYPGPLQAALSREAPDEIRATAFSAELLVIHLLGDVWSSPAIGQLSDHYQSQGTPAAGALARALGLAVPVPLLLGAFLLAAATYGVRRRRHEGPRAPPGPAES